MEMQMSIDYLSRVTTLPMWAHTGAAAATVAGFNWVKARLDASYSASQHPVDYATGQTTFDGARVKGYYAHMIETGTLDIYRTTQLIDFGFILAIACMGIFVCTLVARVARHGSWGRRLGLIAGLCAIVGALSDGIENGWSFIMLANPKDFANWLALPYSSFASLKFALITLAMLCLLTSAVLAATGRLTGKSNLG